MLPPPDQGATIEELDPANREGYRPPQGTVSPNAIKTTSACEWIGHASNSASALVYSLAYFVMLINSEHR